ncbi:MAG: hypothetical protein U5O39_15850 [Gammaproteobacteria bacterium]|nr:hypothetical protein [Gammaproteobacteria bacterium]
MALYSLAVIAYPRGSWWGFALMMRSVTPEVRIRILVASNVVILAAVAIVLFLAPLTAVFSLAAVYAVIIFLERRMPGLDQQPVYYRAMRLRVSMIAAGSHLLFGWAISAM